MQHRPGQFILIDPLPPPSGLGLATPSRPQRSLPTGQAYALANIGKRRTVPKGRDAMPEKDRAQTDRPGASGQATPAVAVAPEALTGPAGAKADDKPRGWARKRVEKPDFFAERLARLQ